MSWNKILIKGNLGRDPDLKHTPQGTPVCTFTMASNERRKDRSGEFYTHTTWFRITLWGKPAERAKEKLVKGSPVTVAGQMRSEPWTDGEGKERTSLEVDHAEILEGLQGGGERGGEGAPRGGGQQGGGGGGGDDIEDDEIPF